VLVAVDQVVAGEHFEWGTATVEQVGWKAVARCVSDVAAMGGLPVASVVSAALPKGFEQGRAEALADGLHAAGRRLGCPVVGGDVSGVDGPAVLGVTVLAEMGGLEPVRRTGSSAGEGLWVSGRLGGSLGSGRHLRFEPRVGLGRALVEGAGLRPTSMIDLSDGLARDLPRLCEHAVVEADRLPRHDGCDWRAAVGDGEDYELLFTLGAGVVLPGELAGVAVTRIGEVTTSGGVRLMVGAEAVDLAGMGWNHGDE
jgi:thiamine-monophosphate kinase